MIMRRPARLANYQSPLLLSLFLIASVCLTSCTHDCSNAPSVHLCVELYEHVSDAHVLVGVTDQDAQQNLVDLSKYDSSGKAARVSIKPGPAYRPGDHIELLASLSRSDTDTVTVDPDVASDVDLNALNFAGHAQAILFVMNPTAAFRVRVNLYDTVGQPYPNLSLYDWEAKDAFIDLNHLYFADKAARAQVSLGGDAHQGDHIALLDAAQKTDTDIVTVDPTVAPDVDLNSLGFADRAAGLLFLLNPTPTFRLRLDLFDTIQQQNPNITVYDWQYAAGPIDLDHLHFADKAARARLNVGGAAHAGDHVALLDYAQSTDTDTVTLDPSVSADVDLNKLHFADRAAAAQFELNPGAAFHVRVDLFDTVEQQYPNISLYDWQAESGVVDLSHLNFADKAARVDVSSGGEFHAGDHVRLLDTVQTSDTDMVTVDPGIGGTLDLNGLGFADRAAAIQFVLNPSSDFRIRLDLYDTVGQKYPNLSLYDWESNGNLINLNHLHFADKAARIRIKKGGITHEGDHVRLLDAAQPTNTDTVTVSPDLAEDVDLNSLGFAGRAAGVEFMLNPSGTVHARLDLYDTVGQKYPNVSLYDWQSGGNLVDLNALHFANKAARAVLVKGTGYNPGDHVWLMGAVKSTDTDMLTVDPAIAADVNLNSFPTHFADHIQAIQFSLNPGKSFRMRADLFDTVQQPYPNITLYDWQYGSSEINLNHFYFADKAARVIVTRGPAYGESQGLIVYDEFNHPGTDTRHIVPANPSSDVNLNTINFADKAASVRFLF